MGVQWKCSHIEHFSKLGCHATLLIDDRTCIAKLIARHFLPFLIFKWPSFHVGQNQKRIPVFVQIQMFKFLLRKIPC